MTRFEVVLVGTMIGIVVLSGLWMAIMCDGGPGAGGGSGGDYGE